MKSTKRISHEEFIKKVTKVRNNINILGVYINNCTPLEVECSCGWKFIQRPDKILLGQNGCPICGTYGKNQTTETFIERAKRIHGNIYNYDKTVYLNATTKVIITCPIHGDFEQIPNSHVKGHKCGCPECKYDIIGWHFSDWEKAGNKSSNFDSFKLYKIKCFDPITNEEFIKIGKTFTSLSWRFRSNITMPYNYEIIEIIEGQSRFISNLEIAEHQKYHNNKYIPTKPFVGMTECFDTSILPTSQQ